MTLRAAYAVLRVTRIFSCRFRSAASCNRENVPRSRRLYVEDEREV